MQTFHGLNSCATSRNSKWSWFPLRTNLGSLNQEQTIWQNLASTTNCHFINISKLYKTSTWYSLYVCGRMEWYYSILSWMVPATYSTEVCNFYIKHDAETNRKDCAITFFTAKCCVSTTISMYQCSCCSTDVMSVNILYFWWGEMSVTYQRGATVIQGRAAGFVVCYAAHLYHQG